MGFSREGIISLRASLAARLGTSLLPPDDQDEDRLPALPPLGLFPGASMAVAGEEVCGYPTVQVIQLVSDAEPSFDCKGEDVYCYMGDNPKAAHTFIRIPSVRGSVECLLPKGLVMWCREGDKVWSKPPADQKGSNR